MLIAIIQVLLAFGVAIAYGFGQSGNITPDSLALAVDICLLFSLSVIGIGLMVAAFARNDGEASNLAMLPLVPMAFLSGAIYPMPAVPLLTVAGQTVGIYDIMSSTHAANAMLQILIYGKGPGEIGYSLFMLALLALVYLTIGIGLYQRFRLR
jgi:ABC-2 type transport system permease protein